MRAIVAGWVLAFGLAALGACSPNQSAGEPPRANATTPEPDAPPGTAAEQTASVVFTPEGGEAVTVRVEIARTEEQRRRGLMFRKHMGEDEGMLFLFDEPDQLSFWMVNTYLPLDMIFIEPSLRVLGIVENAEPLTRTSRAVEGQSQYVVEVNAGFSRRYGLTKGTVVRFVGVDGFTNAGAAP